MALSTRKKHTRQFNVCISHAYNRRFPAYDQTSIPFVFVTCGGSWIIRIFKGENPINESPSNVTSQYNIIPFVHYSELDVREEIDFR